MIKLIKELILIAMFFGCTYKIYQNGGGAIPYESCLIFGVFALIGLAIFAVYSIKFFKWMIDFYIKT